MISLYRLSSKRNDCSTNFLLYKQQLRYKKNFLFVFITKQHLHEKKNDEQTEEGAQPFKYSPFRLYISKAEDAEIAILLLQTEEKSILLAVVEALSKYADKSEDNVKVLFHLGVVNNVLPIIEDEDTFIRRFVKK